MKLLNMTATFLKVNKWVTEGRLPQSSRTGTRSKEAGCVDDVERGRRDWREGGREGGWLTCVGRWFAKIRCL